MNSFGRRITAGFLAAALTIPVFVCGAGETAADPYAKLGDARTKAEIALRDSHAVFKSSRSKFDSALKGIQKAKDTITDVLISARKNAEKEEDDDAVAECDKLLATIEQKWEPSCREVDMDISDRYDRALSAHQNARNVFETVVEIERKWKESRIDLAPLEAGYAAIEKRIGELGTQIEGALADISKKQSEWNAELAAVQKTITEMGKTGDTNSTTNSP